MRHNIDLQSITFEVQKQERSKSKKTFQFQKKEIKNTGTYISKFKASREITNYYYKTQRNHSAKAL
jgi:hypothetical protein